MSNVDQAQFIIGQKKVVVFYIATNKNICPGLLCRRNQLGATFSS
jgi:hypothetical protein